MVRIQPALIDGDEPYEGSTRTKASCESLQKTGRIWKVLKDVAAQDHVILAREERMFHPVLDVDLAQVDGRVTALVQHFLNGPDVLRVHFHSEKAAVFRAVAEERSRAESVVEDVATGQ